MFRRLFLIALALVALPAASSNAYALMLHDSSRLAMYSAEAEPESRNSHPAKIEADQLLDALARVRARSGETGEVIELFPKKNREQMAKRLAKELRRIEQDQELHLVSFRHIGSLLSSKRHASAARVFVEGGRLNLIFGMIDQLYSEFRDPERKVPPMGSRKGAGSLNGAIAPAEGVTLVNGRNDWVTLDLVRDAQTPPAAAPLVSHDASGECSAGETKARPERRESITWEELEEGLRMLHRIHSKGLITDQEYDAKKKEMLDAVGPGK